MKQQTKQTLPSIELMYPIALKSYEEAQKRLDVVEKRAQEISTAAATLTAALVAFLATQNHNFKSVWFACAVFAFVLSMALSVYVRVSGYVVTVDPLILYRRYLNDSDERFKENFIVISGKHFDDNTDIINFKGHLTTAASVLLALEVVLIVIHFWVG